MASTLRDLLIQRAARLQGRPALTAPGWGTLTYAQLRNRVEGVALGLLAGTPPATVFSATGTIWDWAAELAAAASGLAWDQEGQPVPMEALGGPRFNAEAGRGAYHAREQVVTEGTPFTMGLTHGELMVRLRRLNAALGWDHDTRADLPLARLGEPALRAALWSALFAGAHAVLVPAAAPAAGLLARFRHHETPWDPAPFRDFWAPLGTATDR
ncbi:hypothetical protein [Geothrix terrae]|uniref:hypothetical protein n=1 Tax=Geothrix terrae TaxID=2922720 RepID=UPI001FAD04EE|nr:hypothetical protein [Geothrix terrae]